MTASETLPQSWVSCTLGDVLEYGSTAKAEPSEIPPDAWVLELEDIEKDTSKVLRRVTFSERRSKSTKNRFSRGDVLYGKLRPYLNKVVRADSDGYCTTEIVPLTPPKGLDGGYLFYWLKHPRFLDYVSSASHGLNMPRLGTEAGRAAPFVLAPPPEQKRIADKLDALFARLDACRDRLDRVPEILKRFRQAVLAAATSGELTREWREERRIDATGWQITTFEQACDDITVGHVGTMIDQYRPSGVPFLRSLNVRPFQFDARDLRYITPAFHKSLQKSRLRPGDVVVVRTGAPGQCCAIPDELVDANCSDLVIVRPGPRLVPAFAVVVINSEASQAFVRSEQVGVAQSHFNVGSMKRAPLRLPSPQEQHEIVRRVEALLSLANAIASRTERARASVDRIAPALLDKAFRGELAPRDSGARSPAPRTSAFLLRSVDSEAARSRSSHSRARARNSRR